ncbi:hypothetical protein FDG2_2404 [Candidatus Protofrankia californiensis]|uniref:Uncharacterized protein n=1 Tax=Candidatus Protofrankia californiensis TaxID=1839754 RepID=A0A1C3NXM8_9ACTN|nr:hypothetical protein FDG2_2404 [Candidatus Protofrankia californiensis]
MPAVQVGEPDVPPVGEYPGLRRLATSGPAVGFGVLGFAGGPAGWGALGGPPAGPAPAHLVDPEYLDRRCRVAVEVAGLLAYRVHHRRPRQPQRPGGGGDRRADPVDHARRGVLA